MSWIANALLIFVVVLVSNWLTANVHVFSNYYANLFLWALILSLLVGVGVRVRG